MNLTQAVAEIEGAFGPADKSNPPYQRAIVTSGGIKASARDPEIALYISQDAAVDAWVRQMTLFLDKMLGPKAYQFVDGPHLDKWAMTTTDLHNQQRIAEPRYSVTATVGVEWVKEEKIAEDSANPIDVLMAIPRI